MDAIFLQLLNGLDKGSAYALIALGLTLIFGTLGVVNFAHGALFMLGAFCAVTFNNILNIASVTLDPERTDFLGNPLKVETPYLEMWFGEFGSWMIDYTVPLAIIVAIPVMILIGIIMERGLIKHFYKRPALHHHVRGGGCGRRGCRGHVYAYQQPQLPYGHGFSGAEFRGGRGWRHGQPARRRGCGLPAWRS